MSMLTAFEPIFRDFDRLTTSLWGGPAGGRSIWGHRWMPADVYRRGDEYVAKFDLPGVEAGSVEVTVEKNVLTVSAERNSAPTSDGELVMLAERPQGRFSRQLFLGEDLETDRVSAQYEAGVLTVTIPIAEHAKPRKVEIISSGAQAIGTGASNN